MQPSSYMSVTVLTSVTLFRKQAITRMSFIYIDPVTTKISSCTNKAVQQVMISSLMKSFLQKIIRTQTIWTQK